MTLDHGIGVSSAPSSIDDVARARRRANPPEAGRQRRPMPAVVAGAGTECGAGRAARGSSSRVGRRRRVAAGRRAPRRRVATRRSPSPLRERPRAPRPTSSTRSCPVSVVAPQQIARRRGDASRRATAPCRAAPVQVPPASRRGSCVGCSFRTTTSDDQALEAPVFLRLQHLAHQRDSRARRPRRTSSDRQVAREAVAPQPRLPQRVGLENSAGARARLVDVEQQRRQPLEQPGVLRATHRQVMQQALRVREGQREGAGRRARVVVLLGQAPARRRGRAPRRWQTTAAPGRRAAARTRCRRLQIGSSTTPVVPLSGRPSRARGDRMRAAAPEEPLAVALPLDRALGPALEAQHVHRPHRSPTAHAAAGGRAAPCSPASTRSRRRACRTPGCARSSRGAASAISA